MIGLEYAVLVRSELFKLRLEELGVLVCDGFLIQDQDVGDVVGVNLSVVSVRPHSR